MSSKAKKKNKQENEERCTASGSAADTVSKDDIQALDSAFFTVPYELVITDSEMLYDIYVNSSTRESKEKYVRIFPKGQVLEKKDLGNFKKKYIHVYVSEAQRNCYLQSLIKSNKISDIKKTEVIKDSAITYLHAIFDADKEFTSEVLEETIQGCKESVENMIDVVQDYSVDEIQNLIGDLSFHDFYTYDHSINVAMYSITLYQAVVEDAKREDIIMAGMGGLLHDLGKLKIPTTIINNPNKLTDEEFDIIKQHPDYGKELLDDRVKDVPSGVDLEIVRRVVHEHHENFNGTGYPNGLKGEEIHLMARITAIADFFDAITTKRSYHEVLSTEDALSVMAKSVGKKVDPALFEAFSTKVKGLVFKGKGNIALGDDFDPCQPHNVLPFEKVEAEKADHDLFKKEENFGSVKTDKSKRDKEKKEKKAS